MAWAFGLCNLHFGSGQRYSPFPFGRFRRPIAPLDVHEYVFGCESCRTRLAFEWVRSARPLARPSGSRFARRFPPIRFAHLRHISAPSRSAVSHCWSSSSRAVAFRPRSRANRCMLSGLLHASPRTILRRRNTDSLSCARLAVISPNRIFLSPSVRHSMPPPAPHG